MIPARARSCGMLRLRRLPQEARSASLPPLGRLRVLTVTSDSTGYETHSGALLSVSHSGNADQHDPSRRVHPIPGRVVHSQRPLFPEQQLRAGRIEPGQPGHHLTLERQAPRRAHRRTREKTEILRPRHRTHMINVHTRRVGRPHKESGKVTAARAAPNRIGAPLAQPARARRAAGASRGAWPRLDAPPRAARAAAQPVHADTPPRRDHARRLASAMITVRSRFVSARQPASAARSQRPATARGGHRHHQPCPLHRRQESPHSRAADKCSKEGKEGALSLVSPVQARPRFRRSPARPADLSGAVAGPNWCAVRRLRYFAAVQGS